MTTIFTLAYITYLYYILGHQTCKNYQRTQKDLPLLKSMKHLTGIKYKLEPYVAVVGWTISGN